jgi:hypothetical protein
LINVCQQIGIFSGESLLNDAVAIVLCGAIEDYSRYSLTGIVIDN